ncbi:DUF2218 domain-containing protein [soil metagenome]
MATTTAHVPTTSGSKYMQQLCKHWSHKLTVEFDAHQGVVHFPTAVATMTALPDTLAVSIEAEDAEVLERMKDVVAKHLDRFAFREAPLPFAWT